MTINNPIVVSPDEGGIERAKKFARLINANILSLVKTRDRFTGDVSISLSEELPLKKRTALIVDDMISTGTSVIKAIELLKKITLVTCMLYVPTHSYSMMPKKNYLKQVPRKYYLQIQFRMNLPKLI